MTPEKWQEIKEVLAAALEQPPTERQAYLDRACPDPALRHELDSLLAAHEQGDSSFLQQSIGAMEPFQPGAKLGPYEILCLLGSGGMGTVYRARDQRLDRDVAIKVIRPGLLTGESARKRFRTEALALAKLSHPHVAMIHDVGEQDGIDYLVMECVGGQSLAEKLKSGPLKETEVVSFGVQIADALEEAHEHGLVHRDLKPANVTITPKGQAKVLDFGLAKLLEPFPDAATAQTLAETRAIVGTLPYMSPEQLRGDPVDARSDVYALGVVMYEMVVGRRPFQEDSAVRLTDAILHRPVESPRALNPRISEALERTVLRCLAKDKEARFASAVQLKAELEALQAPKVARSWKATLRHPLVATILLALLVTFVVLGYRSYVRASRARWAEREALPRVAQLTSSGRPFAALRLLREAEPYARLSPDLARAQEVLSASTVSVQTTPPGAKIYVRDYNDTGKDKDLSGWVLLGTSPLETKQLPVLGHYRIRAVKEGFEPVEWSIEAALNKSLNLPLHLEKATPAGMVWVTDGYTSPLVGPPVELSGYWIDKYEVTNREFKKFVDSGGYEKPDCWKEPFVRDGRVLSWNQAMAQFRDATGRAGPSTWQLGTYPEGTADFPVGGVSWYEAAAYAEFAGKSLPTVYHWIRATDIGLYSDILELSNFVGHGPAPVGSYFGLGPFGTYDMAGNVKEWTLNSNSTGDRRYILGGAWNEPTYQYSSTDARKPLDRLAMFGFRCVRYESSLPKALAAPFQLAPRGRRRDQPANGQVYQTYLHLHSYDKTELKPAAESVDDSSPYWRMEKVTFQAAYGDERVIARLYVPKGFAPPYQVVVFFPGSDAFTARSAEELQDNNVFLFIVRSGRALIFPSYKGMLERGPGAFYNLLGQPNKWTEMNLQWSKDLGRSLDYLETRKDMNTEKVAFCGLSLGAFAGPRLIAVEPRIKTAVLSSGGLLQGVPPEVDSWNYAPRVTIPVLMMNGREDFMFPIETGQTPLFQALGTPVRDKQHVLFEGGHANLITRPELMKLVLDWLDKYLGPVDSRVLQESAN